MGQADEDNSLDLDGASYPVCVCVCVCVCGGGGGGGGGGTMIFSQLLVASQKMGGRKETA